jgi:hypothetical protein
MSYPYELEWIEGANIDQIRWILEGGGLYKQPSITLIPFAYNPLYFMISAGLMKLIGIGFLAPRLISILSTIGILILIALLVTTETNSLATGIISSGIYAVTFRFTGAWMDLAKTDSLFLFLILLGFFIGIRSRKITSLILSGLLLVLAYFTKQLALPIILVMAGFSLFSSAGKTWPQWFTIGFTGIGTFLVIEATTGNWFSFYTMDNYLRHERVLDPLVFWVPIIKQMWPTMLISLPYPIFAFSCGNITALRRNDRFWGYIGLGVGLIIASWTVFTKIWTYANGFMPAAVGLAILAGLGLGEITKRNHQHSKYRKSTLLKVGALSIIVIQFAILAYNPLQQLPSKTDRMAREDFIQQISNLQGEILVLHHGYMNYLAGKNSYFHSVPYGDVVGGTHPPKSEGDLYRLQFVQNLFSNAITNQTFEWIVVGEPVERWLPHYLDIGEGKVLFSPATGAPAQPEVILRRNPIAIGGEFPITDDSYESLFGDGWSEPREGGRYLLNNQALIRIALESGSDYQMTVGVSASCMQTSPIYSFKI